MKMLDNKISVYRAEKKMTQQELADAVGVSRQTILSIEKNRYNPSLILAIKIAKAVDKPIMDVFDYKEE
ncbi:DNA-binding protein [Bacillus sp. NRRL B-14911]|nr:DNA-binding protein [Bacillus sp. NRRL B-14911]